MTIEQLKQMQHGYPPFFACGVINTDFQHHFVQPIPEDLMAHAKTEKVDTDYNGLSLEQCAAMTRFKNMDALHKADAVADDFRRSQRLVTEFNEIGRDAFISRRISKNN